MFSLGNDMMNNFTNEEFEDEFFTTWEKLGYPIVLEISWWWIDYWLCAISKFSYAFFFYFILSFHFLFFLFEISSVDYINCYQTLKDLITSI